MSTYQHDPIDREQCPEHGWQNVVDHSVTRGHDPYDIAVLACGHGVACFGPGDPMVIVTTSRRKVAR